MNKRLSLDLLDIMHTQALKRASAREVSQAIKEEVASKFSNQGLVHNSPFSRGRSMEPQRSFVDLEDPR